MTNIKNQITVHMVVKNEDQWVWFAIQSILPFVDKILITDTGSTDHTIQIINSINSDKITFTQILASTAAEVTRVRQHQLENTTTTWCWAVDGDEVYPERTTREVVEAINSNKWEGVTVRRYDLLGDIYHRQVETVGEYQMFGQKGHMVLRALNLKKIPGLHLSGDYPIEGYYDAKNVAVLDRQPSDHYITKNYLYHAMYLRRSSLGENLPMFNRGKYKIETGIKINDSFPEVFKIKHPPFVPNPLVSRGVGYELLSGVITPIKNIKRRFL